MSRDHSQSHYGPNASFDGYDSDLASAGILIESLRQQLAAEQAKNVGLREALEHAVEYVPELATVPGIAVAISAPSDTSALEAYVTKAGEKMREKCLNATADTYGSLSTYEAIRALPRLTLEDLSKSP